VPVGREESGEMLCCETAPESVAHRSRHIKDILHTTMAKRGYELHPLNKS